MKDLLDWERILFNDLPIHFLGEIVLRSVIMFVIILLTLRISGKRGMKQLSVFELVLIIGLGSAAGDPMFYEDVGIIHALTVFIVIILLYSVMTALTDRVSWVEQIIEGKPVYLMKNGCIVLDSYKKTGLSKDEFFGGLRMKSVEHLGQINTVLVETSGDFSVLFYPDKDVKPGLPIFPHLLETKIINITQTGIFACYQCGKTESLALGEHCCSICKCKEWALPIQTLRIA